MAEGIELSSSLFYCYRCDQEVSLISSELICPECFGGFLEEVPQEDYEDESDVDESELNLLDVLDLENIYRRAVENHYDDDSSPINSVHEHEDGHDEADSSEERPEEASNPQRTFHGSDEMRMLNLTARMPHLGNYLLGDDLDALSTFFLNEEDILGPPALPPSKIRLLPIIEISEKHIEKGMQCSICMEDFTTSDKAKNLPCDHAYHEECINPWLLRHATCPNCRKTVEVEVEDTKSKDRRSRSCPRSYSSEAINSGSRYRYAETRPSLGTIFSATVNPFRLF